MEVISEFRGEYGYLSNYHPSPIERGRSYPTAEHLFQAGKALLSGLGDIADVIAAADSPGEAKRLGRQVALEPGFWERRREEWMRFVVHEKFAAHPDLASLLAASSPARLVEGNRWGDTVWGVDLRTGRGRNLLGRILEDERERLLGA